VLCKPHLILMLTLVGRSRIISMLQMWKIRFQRWSKKIFVVIIVGFGFSAVLGTEPRVRAC
jgi:hypothetical protein